MSGIDNQYGWVLHEGQWQECDIQVELLEAGIFQFSAIVENEVVQNWRWPLGSAQNLATAITNTNHGMFHMKQLKKPEKSDGE